MGKSSNRSTEYFFTGKYYDDNNGNSITAIGVGGEVYAYGGDDDVIVGSLKVDVYHTNGELSVKGASGYTGIRKTGNGGLSFAGAAGAAFIDHIGETGNLYYSGVAGYNKLARKGLSGDTSFKGAGGYNQLWHETDQGNVYFVGAGAANEIDRTWFNHYQGTQGDVTFNGAGAANSIDSRVESGDITLNGIGADNHIVRKGREGNITLNGAGASNRIERIRHSEDVYEQTQGNITFEGAGGYNKLYSDVAQGNIHFTGAGAYNEITRTGVKNEIEFAQAKDIIMTSATVEGRWIEQSQQVTAIKSTIEPDTYLFAFADEVNTKVVAVRLQNNPDTGELRYYSTSWYKKGHHLKNLAAENISVNNGFFPIKYEGAITLSNINLIYRQKTTIQSVEEALLTDKWVTYAGGMNVKAEDVTLNDAKMGGYAIGSDGFKVDVSAVKSNVQPNTYVYAAFLEPYTKVVAVKLKNDPETGKLKYIARAWYKKGNHTDRLVNETFSYPHGYKSIGAGYTLSQLHYDLNVKHDVTDSLTNLEGYSEQDLIKLSRTGGNSAGDIYFNGVGGGNIIISNVTHGNINFTGAGAANIILHNSTFGNTHFEGAGAANVIVKSGEEGDLTFRGAGLGNVLVHQSQNGEMDIDAGGAANVLVRVGDGRYLAHLLAYGNISIHKGNGNSRVLMLGGYNTHTQIGDGSADWSGVGGFNVITQAGKGNISSVFLGGANVLTKLGAGDLVSGMLGGANIITHLSDETETSNTTAIALGGANILTKKGKGNALAIMVGGTNVLTHVGDGNTTGIMLGGANILTKVGQGDTTGILFGIGNVFTHVGGGLTLGVMAAAGNIFTKVGDGASIAAMVGVGNLFTHVGKGDAWALMGGAVNIFTKVGDGNALALMIAAGNVFTHIGDGTSVALMLAKGNIATKVGNGITLSVMIGKANVFTHVGDGNTFAAMIGGANMLTKVGNDMTAALMMGKANIYSHVGNGTSIGLFAGELNVMTKVGEGTTLAAMFGKANIMTHAGNGLTGVLALGEANIVTKVGDDFMGIVAAAKANIITHVGDATTAGVLLGKGNILTKVGNGTTVGLLVSDVGNVMTHVGKGTTVGFAKGKANIITKVGDGTGINAVWGEANILTQVGNGDRYNFAKGKANIITKVGDKQEVTVVQGAANIITHVGNGDDYTGAWGEANVITKVGEGRNVVLAKGKANIVTQVGKGDSFNALWSEGNIVTKVGDGMQVTAAKGKANVTTTVGNGLNVTAAHGDANINTHVGNGVSVNVAWGKYNVNTKVGDGLNIAVMKGKGNANIHVGDGLGINASYARNNVAVKIGNGDFYSFSVAESNKLPSLFENIKQTALGVGGSQAINYLVQGDEVNTSGTHKGRGAINLAEVSAIDGFQMDEIAPVSSDLNHRLNGTVTAVETPDVSSIESALNRKTRSISDQNENLIVNGDFEQGELGWQSTNDIEAYSPASAYGLDNTGDDERVSKFDVDKNTVIWQELQNLSEGEVISLTFDFVSHSEMMGNDLNNNGMTVLWNGKPVFSVSGQRTIWHTQKLDLMAEAGTNRIEFKGTGQDDGFSYILDNIVVKSETSLIVNDDFKQSKLDWQNDIAAYSPVNADGPNNTGYGERVCELDVDGNTTIYQDLQNLCEGEVISLSFDFANRPDAYSADNGMDIFWNGKLVFSTFGDAAGWQNKTLELIAKAGSNRIEFKGTGLNDGIGYIVDNIIAKSENPRETNVVTEHVKQDKAVQNALSDKEKAEKDRQLLEQEKEKQLAAIAKSQSQLELMDQAALNQSGLIQRNAIEAEAQAETDKLISMTQGLDVLDNYANYRGQSGNPWRNQFATRFLNHVQDELNDTKFITQKKLANAQQLITDNQQQIKEAVTKSEIGVAQSEQHRTSVKQDIAEAQEKAELRKIEALLQQQQAKDAENDANIAYQKAEYRGKRDIAAAASKIAQVQADAKGAKQSDSRPDRTGAGGSGLSGKAYESTGAGETSSYIDPELIPEAEKKFYKGLTEEELQRLADAKQAVDRLQINAGIRAENTSVLTTSKFAKVQSDNMVMPTSNTSGEFVRKPQKISGINLASLGDDLKVEQHNSAIFDNAKFNLLKEGNKLFINPHVRTLGRKRQLSKALTAVRDIFYKTMSHFDEEHVMQFEQALSHWQQRNPKEFALRISQVNLIRFRMGRMMEHLQAQRAESVGVLGITVEPQHAEQLNQRVIFDGTGRIVGLQGSVTQDEINQLVKWKITPLTRKNSTAEREAPKTESESLIVFMSRLEAANIPEAGPLIERARELWLTGQVTSQETIRLFHDAASQLQSYPELHGLVLSLQADAHREKSTTQYIDNLFGRRFDSELAHTLVKTASPEVIATSRRIGQFLVQEFELYMQSISGSTVGDGQIAIKMQAFAEKIKKDIRPWFSRVPELTTFLQKPTFDNFKIMMTKVDNGFEMIKIPFLAVKMSNTDGMGLHLSQWKAEADIFYRDEIYKARSTSSKLTNMADVTYKVKLSEQQTNDYGIALPYQPSGDQYEDFLYGRKVAAGRVLTPGQETTLERNALAQGHSVVTGASGSTNIMVHLNNYIASQDPTFSQEQAYLNTLVFLVFDGGHSVNESLVVYKALQETGDERKQVLQNYTASYMDLMDIAGGKGKPWINQALDSAFEKTQHLYRENTPEREQGSSSVEALQALSGKNKTSELVSDYQHKNRDTVKNSLQKSGDHKTRFDSQLIIQMENDPIVEKAALNLAGKHPDSSVVVKLDSDGKYHVIYGDPDSLSGKLRWQIVGHGRDESEHNNMRLSGHSADELAIKLKQFSQNFEPAGKPDRISIVGCSLISDDKRNGFAYRFITALDKQGIRSDVSARRSEVAVDATGRKFTRDKNNQWVNKLDDNKLVLRWNEQGELMTTTEKLRRGVAESDINLARVGYTDADSVTKGAIADNHHIFTAPGKRKNRIEISSNPQSDKPLSYTGNIQVNVGDGEFTAVNWGTSNVGIKVGTGGFKSLAFGDNNVMVHIGDGDSKHSVNLGGYQALEGAQMFIGNRNVSFNRGRSNDLIVMMDKSIPTPPLVNPFDGAVRITGVLKSIARSGEEGNWLTAQERQWTLSGAKKFVQDISGLDQTSSVDYKTLVDLDSQHERSSRGLKSDTEAALNKKYHQWLSSNGNNTETGKISRAGKFRQANEKLAFNFAVGGQGADIQVTTGSWNFMFGDHIQSILDTNLGSLFGLMTQQSSTTGMARTTFTYTPQDLPRQLKNKLLGRLASVNADTTLADIFAVDYTPEGQIVSRTGEPVDGKAILQEMLEVINKFGGDQLRAFTDPDKLIDNLKQNADMSADSVESFFVSHGLKEKAPDENREKSVPAAINSGNLQTNNQPEHALGFNSLNLPNLFTTIFSKDKQQEMQSLVTNLKENLTADLLNIEQKTFDFLRNSGHLQGDSDIHVSLGNYNFNWGGDGKDLGAYLGDNNNFWGGRGDDVYYSIGTSNIFTGGEGNDLGVLMGRENWMFGGKGDDTAVVAGRINQVFMGEGNDQSFVFGEGGFIDAGNGQDYVVTSGNYNRVDTGEDQDYTVTIGNNNRVELGKGNDFARVFGNGNRIDGNMGDDVIKLMGYHAVINGGGGDDHLIAATISKFSQFDGGDGQDLLVLGGYQNRFQGGAGVDSFVVSGKVIDSQVDDINAEDMIAFNGIDWQNLWFQRSGYDLVLSVNRRTQDKTARGLFESVGSVTFNDYFNGNRAKMVIHMENKDSSGQREFTALSDNAVDSLIQAMSGFAPTAGDNGFIESLGSKAKAVITTAWMDTVMGKGKFA
ncbi:MARTX multifunctional-autoprocessing repeats-in-toxin holotoxin RtxA [Photorhabdus cinerea]|uniref:MARTX multifunctional-autoprocessing repeats-in-toxin holotoxin RtxA n=1 Tax=Photorhabdus cinerea TaxID=471575 RepID=A0A7X5QGH9_9GAMM|nr:MARTX multifunctional-autoprocessing repeats-in-toxin holotoxin RtxA [Photorhabdus cinerea]NHB93941.1 MARTX multifunctional-autoprocessing repeats-in-toxin holotoxin RtxA [Photorhabdus cinerea]